MTTVRHLTLAFLWVSVLTPAVCFSDNAFLKEMPKEGAIRFGKIVHVDVKFGPRISEAMDIVHVFSTRRAELQQMPRSQGTSLSVDA